MAKKTTKEAEIEAAAKEEVKAELQQAQEEAQQAQEEAGSEPDDGFMNPPEDPKTGHLDAGQLATWNKKDLVDLAKDLEIKGAHDMSKEDIIAAIVAVEVEIPSEEEAGAEDPEDLQQDDADDNADDNADAAAGEDAPDADFKKGQEYAAKTVMPLYDKIGGNMIGSVYKNNKVNVKDVKKQGGKVWIETDKGFVVGAGEAIVYFA